MKKTQLELLNDRARLMGLQVTAGNGSYSRPWKLDMLKDGHFRSYFAVPGEVARGTKKEICLILDTLENLTYMNDGRVSFSRTKHNDNVIHYRAASGNEITISENKVRG